MITGCWYRYSNTLAQFTQNGFYYFFGADELGEEFMNTTWTLSGKKETETPEVNVSSEVTYPEWNGSLKNGASGVNGSVIAHCSDAYGPDEVPANANQNPPSGWCSISDGSNHDHNMCVQYSWMSPEDDSDYWYTYACSVVSHSANVPATSYTFDAVTSLPADPADGGIN